MKIPELKIGNLTATMPVVQGGMGVRVSLSSLASAVANEGGIGTISSIGLGETEASKTKFDEICRNALTVEIRKARQMTTGLLAVNVMGVLSNAEDLVKTTVREGIKIIFFGAGLPTKLPLWVDDRSVNLVPIISSARVSELILRVWDKRYGRTVDGFVLEGPLAGGHLGFSESELNQPDSVSLETLLPGVLDSVRFYEQKYGKKIPIIAGGGIYDGKDIARMLALGALGAQMGTRFVCTTECGVSQQFKQAYLDSRKEDIVIIKSPVGMPGRAIRNKFLKDLETNGRQKVKCNFRCLTACKVDEANYCIARALVNSYLGDVDNGLIFCGQNAHRINEIISVKELFTILREGLIAERLPELRAA
jgi:nitronate monooxygenase